MRIPLSWLNEYVNIALSPEELAARLTLAGTEVGGIRRAGAWEGVVVGDVRKVSPHPRADRLRLVTVDTGPELVEVVCGAPNVAEGQKIAYAAIGARLIDPETGEPSTLKRAKIRGVVSNGMVCSQRELGLGDDHQGILVLDATATVGAPLTEHFGDVSLDLELTPNRPDCLAVLGVAREVAALTGEKLKEPPLDYRAAGSPVAALARVQIEDPDLCPRYLATVIQGVKIGPSPTWLADRLVAVGERPINNVVDATNYVMFELGQPLHAFDYHKVADHTIVVRRARAGERLVTLDDQERHLDEDMLVIADPAQAIGLGGVMGGANSEITEGTTSILLESANFNGPNNRRTARALGLTSEATVRFEKGLRPELAEVALRRAARLILEVAGGTAAQGVIDEWPGQGAETATIRLPRQRVKRVLGIELSDHQVEATLGSLGFTLSAEADGWTARVPYWRPDVTIPEDLCEELARVIGYDSIPTTMLSGPLPAWQPQPEIELRDRARQALVAAGMQETISYPVTTIEAQQRVRPPGVLPAPMRLANPMSREQEYMRTTLREGILKTLDHNARVWHGPIALFEVGRTYLWWGEGLPEEREMLVGAMAGRRSEPHWAGPAGRFDFYDAKGALEALLATFKIDAVYTPAQDATFEPGRAAAVTVPSAGGLQLGMVGEVAPDVLAAMDIDLAPVAMFEIDMKVMGSAADASAATRGYKPFVRFPESSRDLALVVDATVPAGEIIRVAQRNRLAVRAHVFDIYEGEGLAPGKKSLAVRVVYQSPERTLTAEDVTKAEQSILRGLRQQLGAELRAPV